MISLNTYQEEIENKKSHYAFDFLIKIIQLYVLFFINYIIFVNQNFMIQKLNSKKVIGYSIVKIKPTKKESESKQNKKQVQPTNKHKLLIENKSTINNINNSYISHRSSIDQNISNKWRKSGILSQQISKQGTPRHTIDPDNHNKHQKKQSEKNIISDNNKTIIISPRDNFINKNSFSYKHVIGKGGFGKVWKVQLKKNKRAFALKQMSKALILTKKSVPSVMNQRKLLEKLNHPFLVNMVCSFQDQKVLYLVMDLMPGGDLRYHIGNRYKFNQQQAKFFVACIYLGLQSLHSNNIIHRDIKPENLVFDQKGYLRITDLGIARIFKNDNSADTSGTPGYMGKNTFKIAPQVICRQNHSYGVDYFALGVIAYEIMIGKRPYLGRNRNQIREQILARQIQVKKHEIPEGWSLQSADFVNRLIQRKPSNRLGYTGFDEIKNHAWLRQFPWEKLYHKQIVAPYQPDINIDNFDQKQITTQNQEIKQLLVQNTILLRKQQVQSTQQQNLDLFQGYQCENHHI